MLRIALFLILLFTFTASSSVDYDPFYINETLDYSKSIQFGDPVDDRLETIFQDYYGGNYRRALMAVQEYIELELPDGRRDLYRFISAECRRQLKLSEKAVDDYSYLVEEMPESPLRGAALYRLQEMSFEKENFGKSEAYFRKLTESTAPDSVFYASVYLYGRTLYLSGRNSEAVDKLTRIPVDSPLHDRAAFLKSLCHIKKNDKLKAILALDILAKKASSPEIRYESAVLLSEIYYSEGRDSVALSYLSDIPSSGRYRYRMGLKKAELSIQAGEPGQAVSSILPLLGDYDVNTIFEQTYLLERAYKKMGKPEKARDVRRFISLFVYRSRLISECYREMDRLDNLEKNWNSVLLRAGEFLVADKREELAAEAQSEQKKIAALRSRYSELAQRLDASGRYGGMVRSAGMAENRFLSTSRRRIERLLERTASIEEDMMALDTTLESDKKEYKRMSETLRSLAGEAADLRRINDDIVKYCIQNDSLAMELETVQAKFIDWNFILLEENAAELRKLYKRVQNVGDRIRNLEISKQAHPDTLAAYKRIDSASRARISSMTASRGEDRKRLKRMIKSAVELYPNGRYTTGMMMRLAEISYQEASDRFDTELLEYEKTVEGSIREGEGYPEYDFSETIEIYKKIAERYPGSEHADDALYFLGAAYRKEEEEIFALNSFEKLAKNYPESEFFVEAQMQIGAFYFNHPTIFGNSGYDRAISAYKEVLKYKKNRHTTEAVYRLAWCYYMKDDFEKAVSIFRYLVEELDMNIAGIDKDLRPLLKEEALDYIAISLSESDDFQRTARFLKLIGNPQYSSVILSKVAALFEEQGDFSKASAYYTKLIEDYPLSRLAPEAHLAKIRCLESMEQFDKAKKEKEKYFDHYAKGSRWYAYNRRDSSSLEKADSLSINSLLATAEDYIRKAGETGNPDYYRIVVANYRKLIAQYPRASGSFEAYWNLAKIYEQKYGDFKNAMLTYIQLSRLPSPNYRKRAGLNAIAMAQQLDVEKDNDSASVSAAGKKNGFVIAACDNFIENFPSSTDLPRIMLTKASVYYNAGRFPEASEIYREIIAMGSIPPEIMEEALAYLAMSYGAMKEYASGIRTYRTLIEKVPDERKPRYRKLLIEQMVSIAEGHMESGNYRLAAGAFLDVVNNYPGYDKNDIVLFRAASAYEKSGLSNNAGDLYYRVFTEYPESDKTAGALFNSGLMYSKAENFSSAENSYDVLLGKFPESRFSKDALYNLIALLEKTGNKAGAAAAGRKFASLYSDDKDAPGILFKSGRLYAESGDLLNASKVFSEYAKSYPGSPESIEGRFIIAGLLLKNNKPADALKEYRSAVSEHLRMTENGKEGNPYYAAEASWNAGNILFESMDSVKLELPQKIMKKRIEEKSGYLKEAVRLYRNVIKFKSERLLEAAYRIGRCYEVFARDYYSREADPELLNSPAGIEDRIKHYTAVSAFLKKAIDPYMSVLDIASRMKRDSTVKEDETVREKAEFKVGEVLYRSIEFKERAARFVMEAPVPGALGKDPFRRLVYRQTLAEKVSSMLAGNKYEYLNAYRQLSERGLSPEWQKRCSQKFTELSYEEAAVLDNLAVSTLERNSFPSDLTERQKEDLIFQMEDFSYFI
ncbi:MAG: tetratricopeptide repeat protein [Fibrobacterota bacterium]